MAEATWQAANAAWAAVVLTVIGIVLIWLNLVVARKAVEHAGEGTKAAQDAVAVTRDLGMVQVRAYIDIHKSQIIEFEAGKNFVAKIEITNTGQSPAKNMAAIFTVYCVSNDVGKGLAPEQLRPSASRTNIGARSGAMITARLNRPLREDEITPIRVEDLGVFVVGCIEYEDVFGQPQFVTYKAVCQGHTAKVGEGLAICEDGNEAS